MHELIDLIDLIYEKINYIIYTLLYKDAHVYHMHIQISVYISLRCIPILLMHYS